MLAPTTARRIWRRSARRIYLIRRSVSAVPAADRTYPAPDAHAPTSRHPRGRACRNQAMTIQQGAKFSDVIGQMFKRHAGIFTKEVGLAAPFALPGYPYRFFTHRVGRSIPDKSVQSCQPITRFRTCHQATASSRWHSASTCPSISASPSPTGIPRYSGKHFFIRHIGNQFANGCQTISSAREVRTLESTVSTDKARINHKGRCYAARNQRSRILHSPDGGLWVSGVISSRASVIKHSVPFRPR